MKVRTRVVCTPNENKDVQKLPMDEVELDDAPLSFTFAEQSKQRALQSKKINAVISDSRRQIKLLRREKHSARLAAKVSKSAERNEDDSQTLFQHLDKNKKQKSKKCASSAIAGDEFTVSKTFDPLTFANELVELEEKSSCDKVELTSCKRSYSESDEGYNGSDEQDLRKPGTGQLIKEHEDPIQANDFSDVQYAARDIGSNMFDHKKSHRAGKRMRRRGQLGAFHVELLTKDPTEKNVHKEAQQYLYEKLFQPVPQKQFGDFDRVQSEVLTCLARKRKMQRIHR